MHVWSAIVIRGPVKAQSTSYVVDTILWLRMKTFCLVIAHGWFVIWITCSFSLFLMCSNVHLTSWIVNFDCATTALKLRCCLYREHSSRLWASPSCLAQSLNLSSSPRKYRLPGLRLKPWTTADLRTCSTSGYWAASLVAAELNYDAGYSLDDLVNSLQLLRLFAIMFMWTFCCPIFWTI